MLLVACEREVEMVVQEARPVRTITVDKRDSGAPVVLTGRIKAAHGKDVWQAAIDASSSRFRPIMLTAVSTVLGMIPIAPTVFWGPMAFAIMGGLLVGTVLTLVFLPTLYVAWFSGTEAAWEKQGQEEPGHASRADPR